MTATATKTRKPRIKPQRTLRVGAPTNGVVAVAVTEGKETTGYYVRELEVDFGRGFKVEKFDTDEGSDPESRSYDVHLDTQLGDSCTCRGFLFHKHGKPCRHIAAVNTLIQLGTFGTTAVSYNPAETEEAEYVVRESI